ncbi:MAG: outer membrane protein assembly factor BamB family protein [Planctomycetota bacterium]|jgi:outer membrane protein assembly factor BamB
MNQTVATSDLENNPKSAPAELGYLFSVRTTTVAGVFTTLVCVLLLGDYTRRQIEDPWQAPQFQSLKAEVELRPLDEGLKADLRDLDLELRAHYFRQRRFAEVGTWLLLGGLVVFLVSAKSAAAFRRKLPRPGTQTSPKDLETSMNRLARWAVVAVAVLLAGGTLLLTQWYDSGLPSLAASGGPGAKPAPVRDERWAEPFDPFEEEALKYWHRFRGPGGSGISAYDNVPTSWNGSSGEGVVWKTPVPLPGHNSPVVWNDRVFLSGATERKRQVFCFDTADGKLLWKEEVPSTAPRRLTEEDIMEDTGYAAPTTATDGQRVFAMFANGDVGAFDFEGYLVWARSLGIPDNGYGHAASLARYQGLLLIQFDQGDSADDEKSRLLGLNALTGETVYEVIRPVPNSWMSPIVIRHQDRDQVITGGDPWVISYNPADGGELWRADCLRMDCGPSPVFSEGVVHVGNEYCQWTWIRADGEGDVTGTDRILLTAEDGLPDTCSPLVTPEFLFLLAYDLYCYDVTTGELLWDSYEIEEVEFDAGFVSSPGWANGRLYLFEREGKGWIIEPTRETGKLIATTELGEECVTSPAFQDGRIYIRGKEHLFCIGQK